MFSVRYLRHSIPFFRHHIPTEFLVLGILEFLVLIVSLYLGLSLRFIGYHWHEVLGPFFPKAVAYAVIMQMSMLALGLYQRQTGRFVAVIVLRICGALLLGLIPLAMSFYIAPTLFLGRGVLALTVLISFILIIAVRLYFRKIVKERNMWTRVLVLGAGDTADLVRESVKSRELKGINIVAYMAMPGDVQQGNAINSAAPKTLEINLVRYTEENDIDEIVLAVDDRRIGLPNRALLECKMRGVAILDLLTFFERRTGKVRLYILNPSWLYLSDGFCKRVFRGIGKRVFDLAIVLLLLPILSPVMVLAAIAILVESGGKGPVLYKQTRVKFGGEPFVIYKFRSMVVDAEPEGEARWAVKNDSRITRVGAVLRRSRIDEIPQIFNVLKGDMSFVGPRPERPEFVRQLASVSSYYCDRHQVKPGVTGWAQICYPYGETVDDGLQKLQFDLYYVKNYSIFLDSLILLQTAEVVLLGKGAQ